VNPIRIVFALIVFSLIGFDITEATASPGKMVPTPDQKSSKGKMVFWRHMADGPACLEYSWVSEGKRRMVQLVPGTQLGEGLGPISNASHVQIYSLSNNGRGGVKQWQFPPGPPYSGKVVGAIIEVRGMEVVGTVYYNDGTSAVDRHPLDPAVRTCSKVPKKK